MKKSIPGLACFFLILSCGIEGIPKSVTIKGNPEVYAPLGSPFAGLKDGDRLEDMISPSYIKEMMNRYPVNGQEIEIYEASEKMAVEQGIDKKTLTYLVQFPLTKLSLNPDNDILKALDDVNAGVKIEIPSISGITSLPSPGNEIYIYDYGTDYDNTYEPNRPFMKIPLKDMAESIVSIEKGATDKFGLVINYTKQLEDYLELYIPAFGIDWTRRTNLSDNTKLEFVKEGGYFYPATDLKKPAGSGADGEIFVYARISGPCSGELELKKILFEWTKAVVNTSSMDPFNTEYRIANSLGDFLGGEIKFQTIKGFVYMSGLKSPSPNPPITMNVHIASFIGTTFGTPVTYQGKLEEKEHGFRITEKSDGTKIIDGNLNNSSFNEDYGKDLDLSPIFDGDGAILIISINNITTLEVERSVGFHSESVQFCLFALIPLDLKVWGEDVPNNAAVDGVDLKEYMIMQFGDKNVFNAGTDDDLFGRKDGDDNMLEDVEYVEIVLRGVDITIIEKEKLAVLITNKDESKLLKFTEDTSLRFLDYSLYPPFNPEYRILLKKDDKNDAYGSFVFLRSENPSFDFKIDVRAKVRFEHTINF